MSALGGKADVRELPSGCLLIAKSGHSKHSLFEWTVDLGNVKLPDHPWVRRTKGGASTAPSLTIVTAVRNASDDPPKLRWSSVV